MSHFCTFLNSHWMSPFPWGLWNPISIIFRTARTPPINIRTLGLLKPILGRVSGLVLCLSWLRNLEVYCLTQLAHFVMDDSVIHRIHPTGLCPDFERQCLSWPPGVSAFQHPLWFNLPLQLPSVASSTVQCTRPRKRGQCSKSLWTLSWRKGNSDIHTEPSLQLRSTSRDRE